MKNIFVELPKTLKSKYNYRDSEIEPYPDEKEISSSPGFIGIALHLLMKGANFAIVEYEYVDEDYLADFSWCLVKEYYHLKKLCHRISFFKLPESFLSDIQEIIDLKDDGEDSFDWEKFSGLSTVLQEKFLGFMVIRPLPLGFVGRTVLSPLTPIDFPKDQKKIKLDYLREFPYFCEEELRNSFLKEVEKITTYSMLSKNTYLIQNLFSINIFGLFLSLNSSLYVERCPSAGVCASASVYLALQNVKYLFPDFVKAPLSKITYLARNQEINSPTTFHGSESGLTIKEIQMVFEKLNGNAHIWIVSDNTIQSIPIPVILGSYLHSNIPVIIAITLERRIYRKEDRKWILDNVETIGAHALTAIGYFKSRVRYDKSFLSTVKSAFESFDISALIVQDDIRFPFSILQFKPDCDNEFEFPPLLQFGFEKQFKMDMNLKGKKVPDKIEYRCVLLGMVAPVDDFVRLDVSDIFHILIKLRDNLMLLTKPIHSIFFRWHIDLMEIHKFRDVLTTNTSFNPEFDLYQTISQESRLRLLTQSGPKYFWRCRARGTISNEPDAKFASKWQILFEIHIETSGIQNEISLRRVIVFGKNLAAKNLLCDLFNNNKSTLFRNGTDIY